MKRFGAFTAVDDLSFSVSEGGVFGFLGGNGAGKTTSLRMVLDLIRPASGRIEVFGQPPSREHASAIGFLPEERGLYRRMTVMGTIIYFGQLKAMSATAAYKASLSLIERLGLSAWTNQPIDKLSKGMSQKVQLATALINSPKLLILDEPFAGLDPVNQGILEKLILEMARDGSTVIFSTHIMQHAERLCDRLLLLSRGRSVFEGTQAQARSILPSRLSLTSRTDPSALPGVLSAKPRGGVGHEGWIDWDIQLTPGVEAADLLYACTHNGFELRSFEAHKPSLHDVFLHLVGPDQEVAR